MSAGCTVVATQGRVPPAAATSMGPGRRCWPAQVGLGNVKLCEARQKQPVTTFTSTRGCDPTISAVSGGGDSSPHCPLLAERSAECPALHRNQLFVARSADTIEAQSSRATLYATASEQETLLTAPHATEAEIEILQFPTSSASPGSKLVVKVDGERFSLRGQHFGCKETIVPIGPEEFNSSSLLNLCEIAAVRIPVETLEVLNWITTSELADKLDSLCYTQSTRNGLRVSRGFGPNDYSSLTPILEQTSQVVLVSHCFKVPKATGGGRFIFDGREFNLLLEMLGIKCPAMDLPDIREVIQRLLHFRHYGTIDAKNYFYQFMVHERLRRYFGARLGSKRGIFKSVRMCRLPMEVIFAPCVGQCSSNLVLALLRTRCEDLDYDAVVWVDNFIFAADSDEVLDTVISRFHALCQEVNLTLKVPILSRAVPGCGGILGLFFENRTVRLVDKIVIPDTNMLSGRAFMESYGKISWANYCIGHFPLCSFPQLNSLVRQICSERNWDANYHI